jgi:iron(III) transport system ATP-binding protein
VSDLSVRGLAKAFGPTRVLQGLDLEVAAGSLAAVLGPSGCGKTTLLRLVAGFETPDAGTVTVGGRVVAGPGVWVAPERRRIGFVPQEGALFPHLTVGANVGFGLGRGAARRSRVDQMLELVGLAGLADRMPAELSGGQQQRVAVARALAPRPALVLLDEPFSALDTGLRAAVREDVRTALRATGATAVLVTHDQQEALSVADTVAVLRGGRVVQSGTPGEVYTRPADLAVATFVGEAVVLPAVVTAGRAATVLGALPLRTPAAEAARGHVAVRPEQLLLDTAGSAGVAATVRESTFFGHDALVTLELNPPERDSGGAAARQSTASLRDQHLVTARTYAVRVPAPGSPVRVEVSGPVSFFAEEGSGWRSS